MSQKDDAENSKHASDDEKEAGGMSKDEFLKSVTHFMSTRGTPLLLDKLPVLAKRTLDLFQLYKLVTSRGGYDKVTHEKLWGEVVKYYKVPSTITSAAHSLRINYHKFLYPYEQVMFFHKPDVPPEERVQVLPVERNNSSSSASASQSIVLEDADDLTEFDSNSVPAPQGRRLRSNRDRDDDHHHNDKLTAFQLQQKYQLQQQLNSEPDTLPMYHPQSHHNSSQQQQQQRKRGRQSFVSDFYRYRKRPRAHHKEEIDMLRKIECSIESSIPENCDWALNKICWWSSLSHTSNHWSNAVQAKPLVVSQVHGLLPFLEGFLKVFFEKAALPDPTMEFSSPIIPKELNKSNRIDKNAFFAILSVHNFSQLNENAKLIADFDSQRFIVLLVEILHKSIVQYKHQLKLNLLGPSDGDIVREWRILMLHTLYKLLKYVSIEQGKESEFSKWVMTLLLILLSYLDESETILSKKQRMSQLSEELQASSTVPVISQAQVSQAFELQLICFKIFNLLMSIRVKKSDTLVFELHKDVYLKALEFHNNALLKHCVYQLSLASEQSHGKQCRNLSMSILIKLAQSQEVSSTWKRDHLLQHCFLPILEQVLLRIPIRRIDHDFDSSSYYDDYAEEDENADDYLSDDEEGEDEDDAAAMGNSQYFPGLLEQQQQKRGGSSSRQQLSFLENCATFVSSLCSLFIQDAKLVEEFNTYKLENKINCTLCLMKNPNSTLHFEVSKHLAQVLFMVGQKDKQQQVLDAAAPVATVVAPVAVQEEKVNAEKKE